MGNLMVAALALLIPLCYGKGVGLSRVAATEPSPKPVTMPLIHLSPHVKNGQMTGLYWPAQNAAPSPQDGVTHNVLLLHRDGGSSTDWKPLAQALSKKGFNSLAIDFRNKGRDDDAYTFIEDIQSGASYLHHRHHRHHRSSHPLHALSLVAAGAGANGALQYAATSPLMPQIIHSMALISVADSLGGMTALGSLEKITAIPVLFMAAADEQGTAHIAQTLRKACKTPCTEVLYPSGAQGVDPLLSKYGSEVIQTVTQFMLNPRSYGNTR